MQVAPHAGAWIEIKIKGLNTDNDLRSHPMRVRGLKSLGAAALGAAAMVAPHAGAWIEITDSLYPLFRNPVAPHAGAWIEI